MAFDLGNLNHLLAAVMVAVSVMDSLLAAFVLPKLLAKNPANTERSIGTICNMLHFTALLFLVFSMAVFYFEPL